MNYYDAKISYLRLFNKLKDLDEQLIAKSGKHSYVYARDVIKDRFELGEEAIATDTYWSYLYALKVLDGRFELGEAAIAKDQHFNYWYNNTLYNVE